MFEISVKRMTGPPNAPGMKGYRKGKRFGSWRDVDSELWLWSQHVGEDGDTIAYHVDLPSGERLYGSFELYQCGPAESPDMRSAVVRDYPETRLP